MRIETLHKITGIFKNCTWEHTSEGVAVFDAKKRFVCEITLTGVSLRYGYEHAEGLKKKFAEIGVDFWEDEVHEKMKLEFIDPEPIDISESLYGEP